MVDEKPKIKLSEIKDIYDLEDDSNKTENKDPEETNATVTFEEFSMQKDKEDNKKWVAEGNE